MKRFSRTLLPFLLTLLLLSATVMGAVPVAADEEEESVFTYEVVDGAVTITKCDTKVEGKLEIPATIEDCPVTAIADQAFYGCKKLTTITIPAGVTAIGNGAFGECIVMTAIEVDEQNAAFCDVDGILFNKEQTQLVRFPNHHRFSTYTIPDTVTAIGGGAFFGCAGLRDVVIPETVTDIGISAFHFCPNLTAVTIPSSITSIEFGVFSSCIGLTKVTIPSSVTAIGNYAFSSCEKLASVTIPDSVLTIGSRAFFFCDDLTTVTMGAGVTTLGDEVFAGCRELRAILLPDSLTEIGEHAFRYCDALGELTIPASVTTIGYGAFAGCSSLTTMVLPAGLTTIAGGLFRGCRSLTELTIPVSVTVIQFSAFYGCPKLSDVYYDGTVDEKLEIDLAGENQPLKKAQWHCREEVIEEEIPVYVGPSEKEEPSLLQTGIYIALISVAVAALVVLFVRKPKY